MDLILWRHAEAEAGDGKRPDHKRRLTPRGEKQVILYNPPIYDLEGKVSRGGTAILIGHQPTLGRLAALLLAGDEADWAVKKGAVWWFTARVRDGEIGTVLKAVAHPDLL